MKIQTIEVVRKPLSLWGAFWEAQKHAPSATPVSRHDAYCHSLESWWWPQAQVLVRIRTESGATGFGWAEDGTGAASSILDSHFRQLLIGQDASRIESIWDILYRASIPYGRRGAALMALSAVDIALWDLAGKAVGKPVHELLGGKVHDRLSAYASHLQPVEMGKFVEEAKAYVSEGYRGMKMRMPGSPRHGAAGIRMNIERIEAVRDAVGEDIEVMADAYMGWDLRFARQMVREMAPYRIGWIEEPLLPDELDAYADLCATSPVPVSHGENEATRWGFQNIIQRKAAHLLQPDVYRAGGISEVRKIAALAQAAGIEVVPHALGAPTVHVFSTLPNCRMVEVLTVPVWALEKLADQPPLFLGEPQPQDGFITPSDKPGLGVTINPEVAPDLAHW